MKILTVVFVVTLLISLSFWKTFSGSAAPPENAPSFEEVLQAVGVQGGSELVDSIYSEAERTTWISSTKSFKRWLRVSVQGVDFRRQIDHPLGLRTRVELGDDQTGIEIVSTLDQDEGVMVTEVIPMDRDRLRAVRASIRIWGLWPILGVLVDPSTPVVFQGRASGLDRFKVISPFGQWVVSADAASHLIRQVDMGNKQIEFTDYRPVGNHRLPFHQRVLVGNRLLYELDFSTIELNPVFPPDAFSLNAVVQK
jgi:hypothetical protein